MKTSELTGAALDWAVTVCEEAWTKNSNRFMMIFKHQHETKQGYCWSIDWSQGGPIIERELIGTFAMQDEDAWEASTLDYGERTGYQEEVTAKGHTPLIAAMRCYVASKLGKEVEVPEKLL